MESRKPRVLWVGEASFLTSGFGTFSAECLKRLHATGELELTEFGCFGGFDDPRADDLPWRFVGNVPDPARPADVERYNKNALNKFGAWKFEEVCLDVRPDVVFTYRDWWMEDFVFRSPFRDFYHLAAMPTVDAEPQMEQWVASYLEADAVFAYTEWGLDVLRAQTDGRVKARCATPPGVDTQVFRPFPDRAGFKRGMGLPDDSLVVGMVARNQRRKLIPDLVEAFSLFLSRAPDRLRNNAYLYLHTSYPDLNGWDIPKLVRDSGVGHRMLFTYQCSACGQAFPSHFQDALACCRNCRAMAARLPGPDKGVPRETLAKVYNVMDVFVQYATNEGLGIPAVEAASCGVPVMAVDYSAMAEVVRRVGGTPIAVQRFFRECGTDRKLALPDNADLAAKLVAFFTKPESLRLRDAHRARRGVEAYYTYERTASILAEHFRSVPLRPESETWGSPSRLHAPNTNTPSNLSNEEWVRWCFAHVLGRPERADSYAALRTARDLNWRSTTGGMGGLVFNDASALGFEQEVKRAKFDRAAALEQLLATVGEFNHWEDRRCSKGGEAK
jgi:glycosyltransferase involved in cell wall biosynthesis